MDKNSLSSFVPNNKSVKWVKNYLCKKKYKMSIKNNLEHYWKLLPKQVQLIAVSKTKPVEDIQEAYKAGQRIFGENKAQDMAAKQLQLPKDIHWHFIGHLQTNKVKLIASFVHLIHAVDSLKILKEINKQARINNRIIDVLLQFHIAEETTKFGFNFQEADEMLASESFKNLTNIRVAGVMGMATFTDDQVQIKREFVQLNEIFIQLKESHFPESTTFCEKSMGMSNDFLAAIEEGSTMVRIGTSIFGARNY